MITMNQTHDKKFHCTYLLHYYPFDTQICRVDLQLLRFSQRNVELVPDSIELLTDTELTQYFIQGVPYYWAHFVFRNFSGSGAPTEELFTIFQQPWKFATL